MSLLIVDDVSKRYGAHEVLRHARFQIDPGQKVGLVGRNGGGKTTLLRLIEGLEQPDSGRAILRRGARLGHVPQRPLFEDGISVRTYVEIGLAEERRLARELEELSSRLGEVGPAELERHLRRHAELSERLELGGGWELSRRIETVLSGLGVHESLWEREARTLSGGERSRVALARELVGGHDILLLDEPTNHLDLAGIEWIEAWLAALKGAVLVVSHDRRLLNGAVGSILELEHGRVERYPGNYDKYLDLRAERHAFELRAYEQQQDEIRREQAFIRKHLGSQRSAEAKGRQKRLERLVRLERPHLDVRRPVIRPPRVERGGELVLEARGLSGGYGERLVFEGLDLRIGRGQRIGIVGANGAGKSTLLRVLAGRQAPAGGSLALGHAARVGYYDQDSAELDPESTPYGMLRRAHPSMTDLEIRSHLARFLFRGAEVEKPVAALSGGERARLALSLLMLESVSWLALDEPTNHLDLGARAALEEMLGEFDGALVCVSHDRAFLDGLCTHVLEVAGRAELFTGNYTDWRAAKAAREAARRVPPAGERPARPPKRRPQPSEPASAGSPPPAGRRGGRVRNPFLFEKLEARIIDLEAELVRLQSELATEAVYRDPAKLKDVQIQIAEHERELAGANEEWANWESA
jgi:ATP-binding cassette subfamily F protein 3